MPPELSTVSEFSGLEFHVRYFLQPQDGALDELVPQYINPEGVSAAFIGRSC